MPSQKLRVILNAFTLYLLMYPRFFGTRCIIQGAKYMYFVHTSLSH